MYDTIHLRYTSKETLLNTVPTFLHDVGQTVFPNGTVRYFGMIGNLAVSVYPNSVTVKGSLAKFVTGQNVTCLRRDATCRAIEELSDLLHLSMDKANVTRMDAACTMRVQYPIEVYYSHIGTSREYHKRREIGRGLYIGKNNGELCFYDKVAELKKGDPNLARVFEGQYLLRYEQRYTSKVAKQMRYNEVTAALLYDEVFYKMTVERWANGYFNLRKLNDRIINNEEMKTISELKRAAIRRLIEDAGGVNAYVAQIDNNRKRGLITSKQAYDFKRVAYDAQANGSKAFNQVEEMKELNSQIETERRRALDG